jgi:putative flippase GtrA
MTKIQTIINNKIIPNANFFIYSLIGIVNTSIHSFSVFVFIEKINLDIIISNVLAFFISNIISYILNSSYTFKVRPSIIS